jgi:hypothetical protein
MSLREEVALAIAETDALIAWVKAGKRHWIQGAIKHPGAFRRWCREQGLLTEKGTVSRACIEKGKQSSDKTTQARANLAEYLMFGVSRKKGK